MASEQKHDHKEDDVVLLYMALGSEEGQWVPQNFRLVPENVPIQ